MRSILNLHFTDKKNAGAEMLNNLTISVIILEEQTGIGTQEVSHVSTRSVSRKVARPGFFWKSRVT